ncbi:exodeoxyribonuclease V subunit gamma [Arhodomonas sp. SL1]|uniref:exodeoxyribonuclease V subunit gamma n=1 Tax=Arhodomonas sp. SL1 TaxID=3425691 RepID=UPI003F885470
MLVTHHSNRLEALAEALGQAMAEAPLPPLTPETVVVPHASMSHWLSLTLAERQGILANVDFPFLGGLVWRLFCRHWPELPQQPPFDREALRWRLLELVPELLDEPSLAPLRGYLADAEHPRGNRAYQLADRLAGLYDQYLVYRPDWIRQWEDGAEEHWQAVLWRRLRADTGGGRDRAELLASYIADLTAGAVDTGALPPRLFVFGLSSAPPAYLELLAALAVHIPVEVFALNPCLHYWGDVISERGLARLRERWRRLGLADATDYYSTGHPLLSSLGRTGRAFLEALQTHSNDDADHFRSDEAAPESHLGRLQQDILLLRRRGPGEEAQPLPLASADRSLTVHACHGPMREVQVLHDQLRRLFDETDLRPRDVVVMTPDIDTYAPFIEAVFGNAAGARYIPWSIADRTLPGRHPVVQVFAQMLSLPRSRLTAAEVLSILEVPAVHRCFELDAEAVERIRGWVRDSGIRWGADAAHRAEEDLPAGWETHSWRFGLNRLLLGYAMDDDTPLYHDIAPLPEVEGGEAAWLGAFHAFWDALLETRRAMGQDHTPAGWQTLLNGVLETFFRPWDEEESTALQGVRDAVAGFVEAAAAGGLAAELPPDTLRTHLLEALGEEGQPGGYLTGPVTFCAMVPMRSIPFEAVCLIGLNDRDFPRQDPSMDFDLMAREPRPGDRSLREDDRYLFLEALLAARRYLYLSYVGRDVRDDSPRLPSVLIEELNDTLDRGFTTEDGTPPSQRLLTVHPLQPFSPRYSGEAEAALFSYAEDWLRPPDAEETEAGDSVPGFADEPLPEPEPELRALTVDELVRFFRNPAEAFLRLRLDTRLQREVAGEAESEPFALDGLEGYHLRNQLLEQRLAGGDTATLGTLLEASGTLPEGPFGQAVLREGTTRIAPLEERVAEQRPGPGEAVEVDLALEGFTLTGWLDGVTEAGLFSYRAARVGPADQLRVWIRHLALNAMAPEALDRHTRHLGEGERNQPPQEITLTPLAPEQARAQLADLLGLYWEGLHAPLPLPLRSAWAFARELAKNGDQDRAMQKARAAWEDDDFNHRPGEESDPSWSAVFRGASAVEHPEFPTRAERLFLPLLQHRDGGEG